MRESRAQVSLLLAACATAMLGCQQRSAQAPPAAQQAPAAQAPQTAAPAQAAAVSTAPVAPAPAALGSAQYSGNPEIRCDLLEVKRVSGNALLARWRLVQTGADKHVTYNFDWKDFYYIDPAENKKYSYLTDAEGERILEIKWGGMKPGEQWLSWAKFPAPPAASNKISLSIGGFAPFEDVPVGP